MLETTIVLSLVGGMIMIVEKVSSNNRRWGENR